MSGTKEMEAEYQELLRWWRLVQHEPPKNLGLCETWRASDFYPPDRFKIRISESEM